MVSNRYNILNSLSPELQVYSVLDFKDAFFNLTLEAKNQPLFAFECHDPDRGFSGQITWTRLPQGDTCVKGN